MRQKLLVGCLLLFGFWRQVNAIVSEENRIFYVQNRYYLLQISKSNGMLKSARVLPGSFEIATDYPGYSLFFTEFALQPPHGMGEIFDNSEKKTFGGSVTVKGVETKNFARLEFVWDNPYITTTWDYNFLPNKKYFWVNLERRVKITAVYANHQQCVMTNPDFDNHYVVNYEGAWMQLMSRGDVAPGAMDRSSNFQQSMYTAIDQGYGHRFPAHGWYQTEADVTFGIIFPTVSANQRATISYHGGGRTPIPRHPGFSESQFNWFGKSDSEAILLQAGTTYSMQMVYYLSNGSIDSLDRLNCTLFNERHFELAQCEDYSVASWGSRQAYQHPYTWMYPQATTNYITSQELFEHRAISLPRSQNGTPHPHLFNIGLVLENAGQTIDLCPIPQSNRQLKVHYQVANRQDHESFEGEVSWRIRSLENCLIYQVHPASDKLIVRGQIKALNQTAIERLYVDLPFTPRVNQVKKLDDFAWDVRASDTLFGEIGITIYDMEGIKSVEKDNGGLRLIIHDESGNVDTDSSWQFGFKLFPHLETGVDSINQISPFFSKPDFWYREHYVSFPELSQPEQWGICPDNRVVPIRAMWRPDSAAFFQLQLFAESGAYPVQLYLARQQVDGVAIDKTFLKKSEWEFSSEKSVLQIRHHWQGLATIEVLRESKTAGVTADDEPDASISGQRIPAGLQILPNFPNPFQNQTHWVIWCEQPQTVSIKIYNILGQLVKTMLIDSLSAGMHQFSWDGLNDQNDASGDGIYWLVIETRTGRYSRKLALLH